MRSETGTTNKPRVRRPRVLAARIGGVLLVSVFAMFSAIAPASAVTKLTQAQAEQQFRDVGITWSSSGGCTDRYNSTCTSFEQINQSTVSGGITLKRISGCALNVTGGTEDGHAGGQWSTGYTHWNGWKIDVSVSPCITGYIQGHFTYIGLRSDGAAQYKSASGNIYANEGSHWDILYYTCGC